MILVNKALCVCRRMMSILISLALLATLTAAPLMSAADNPDSAGGGGTPNGCGDAPADGGTPNDYGDAPADGGTPNGCGDAPEGRDPAFGGFVGSNSFFNENQATHEFDDMSTPVAAATLDASVPGEMDNHFGNLAGSMEIMVGREGSSQTEYPLAFADAGSANTSFAMPAKDVTVTARWVDDMPIPEDCILGAAFDSLPIGAFKDGCDGLALADCYAQNSAVVQPIPSDAFYLGAADQLLRVSAANTVFDTSGKEIVGRYRIDEDYVFEMSFYATATQTTPCLSFRYGQQAWEYDNFTLTDWHGGMVAYDQDDSGVSVVPDPGRWHRYAVKFRFDSQSRLSYSFFYDDMETPIVSGTRDAIEKYGTSNLVGKLGFAVGLWNVGVDMGAYPLYVNDVLIYQGGIRQWPAKYAAGSS